MPIPCLINVYFSNKVWYTERDVNGDWSEATHFGDGDYGFISTGYLTSNKPTKNGVILSSPADWQIINFHGSGLPASTYQLLISNSLVGDNAPYFKNYWDSSLGAWWANGAWYLVCTIHQYDGWPPGTYTRRWSILKSIGYQGGNTDKPILWEEMDQVNTPKVLSTTFPWYPKAAIRWDGISPYIDICMVNTEGGSSCSLYTYNLNTDTWGSAYGNSLFASGVGLNFNHWGMSNGIFRFPNGDISVVYSVANVIYCRLYSASSGTWGSEVAVKEYTLGALARVGTVIPDPSLESYHLFTYVRRGPSPYCVQGLYHIVRHNQAPLSDLYSWVDESWDAFGNGTVYQNQLFVPFDNGAENVIWVAPITGSYTTFSAEIVPRPSEEVGIPSCCSMFYIPIVSSGILEVTVGDTLLSLSSSLPLSDAIKIYKSHGDLTTKTFTDDCPEIIVQSQYCSTWKEWKSNTLQEVSGCDYSYESSTTETETCA